MMHDGQLPPSPGDPAWDEWVEEQLADVEFDTELGKRMAEDARRIGDDGPTRAEFHDRYSDAVEAEFGVDERPTKEAVEADGRDEPTPKVPDGRPASRRKVLSAMGGVAALGVAGAGSEFVTPAPEAGPVADTPSPEATPDRRMGMVVDTTQCIACLQCSEACKEENDTDVGVHWPYVFRYEDELEGERHEGYLTRHCQHCSEPSCTFVCPTQARYQRGDDGIVLTDYETCVGCKYCQVACPYGVNYLGKDQPNEAVGEPGEYDRKGRDDRPVAGTPPKGVMGKCTFCVHRQDAEAVDNGVDPEKAGTTACEEACPVDVIQFGDMNDPDSAPRQYLRGEHEDAPSETAEKNQYKLLDEVGNEPNVVFVGPEPSKDATPIQGPRAYEDMGMQDGDYDYAGTREGDGQ